MQKRKRSHQGGRSRKRTRTSGSFTVLAKAGEMKYFDTFLSGATIAESTDWTGTELDPATLNTLFAPAEGAAINQRIGRKVNVHKIKLRGIIIPQTLSDQADFVTVPSVRLMLVQDQQTNTAQMQGEQVMAAPGAATVALTACTYQNLANLGRFRVLKDQTFRSPAPSGGTDGTNTNSLVPQSIPFKWNINFKKPVTVHFNAANGGTVADIVDHSWHVLGQKTGTEFGHTVSYQVRFCYKE